LGVVQIPQTRNLVCKYTGIFCSREEQIEFFTVDYSNLGDPVPLPSSAWAEFLSHAGATAEDENCFAGNSDDIREKGFSYVPAPESYQHGDEKWTFSSADNLVRQRNRSLIFDLRIKYTKSIADQNITVAVKPYYLDYRIAGLDKTYTISLPSGTDYREISCEMNIPDKNTGQYKFDFEIADLAGGSDAVHKTLNIVQ
jgi:hypothetical protein